MACFLRLSECFVDGGTADALDAGDLVGAQSAFPVHGLHVMDGFGVEFRRSAAVASACPGCLESGLGAFADEVAFEFGDAGEDMEDELSAGCGGVDAFGEAGELDLEFVQAVDQVDEVLDAAAEAVEFPDDDLVAGAQLVDHALELGAVRGGSGGVLLVDPFAPGLLQCVALQGGILVVRADPGVSDPHVSIVREPVAYKGFAHVDSRTGFRMRIRTVPDLFPHAAGLCVKRPFREPRVQPPEFLNT